MSKTRLLINYVLGLIASHTLSSVSLGLICANITLSVLATHGLSQSASPKDESQPPKAHGSNNTVHEIKAKAVFKPFPSEVVCRVWIADCELGELSASTEVDCAITLSTNSDVKLPLLKLEPTCSCTIAEFSGREISKSETLSFNVRFKSPGFRKDARYTLSANFLDGNSKIIGILRLNGKVKSNLFIEKSIPCFVVKPGLNETTVPVSISAPVTVDSLTIELGTGLEAMVSKVIPIDADHCALKLTISADSQFKNTVGTIKVSDKTRGISDQAEIAVEMFSPVTISPQFFTYSEMRSKATEPRRFDCRVMLRVQPELTIDSDPKANASKNQEGEKELPDPIVTAKIGDKSIETKLTKVSNGIYRLVLSCDEEAAEEIENGKRTTVFLQIDGKRFETDYLSTRRK
jgi:hypothetical protein